MEDLQVKSDLIKQPYRKGFEENCDVCESAIQINNFSCHGRKCSLVYGMYKVKSRMQIEMDVPCHLYFDSLIP